MAGAVAEWAAFTAAGWVAFTAAGWAAFTAVGWAAFMAAEWGFMPEWAGFITADLPDFTGSTMAGLTTIDFTMADSITIDFVIADFSLVGPSHLHGWVIIPTMGITITASPTLRRSGITVPILPDITLT
jgi:hypothetical protein